jgi:hypothetical protein
MFLQGILPSGELDDTFRQRLFDERSSGPLFRFLFGSVVDDVTIDDSASRFGNMFDPERRHTAGRPS